MEGTEEMSYLKTGEKAQNISSILVSYLITREDLQIVVDVLLFSQKFDIRKPVHPYECLQSGTFRSIPDQYQFVRNLTSSMQFGLWGAGAHVQFDRVG